ncbi:MAG: tail fiber domain-containing protein [Bdellovibrionales bacterium]|nr:tail fiber domain-containing protein [Bdellovibrionales bacterium]
MHWTTNGWACTTVGALSPVKTVAGKTPDAGGNVPLSAYDISGIESAATKDYGTGAGHLVELDGTGKIPSSLLPVGIGTISSITATSPLQGGGASGAVTVSIDVGTGANQVVQLNASSQIPAVDGSLLTGVNASKLGTRTVSSAGPTTNQVLGWNGLQWEPMSTATGSVTDVVSGIGLVAGTINSFGTINVDVGTGANQIMQLNGSALVPAYNGSLLTNINAVSIQTRPISATGPTTNQVLGWNGLQWEPMSTATGSVTDVVSGTGLVAGTINSFGTINVDVGTGANQIMQLNGSALVPAYNGSLLTNINAVSLQTRPVSSTGPTPNQVLGWNGLQWEPMSTATGSVTDVVSGVGLVAGTINSFGTINVDVGTGANQVVQLNASSQIPAVDGSLLTGVNASKLGTRAVASTGPTTNQVLGWNGLQWEPMSAASSLTWPLQANPGTTSASTPSYSFNSDASTGLYSPAAGRLALTTLGTSRFTVSETGNIGIGAPTPNDKLQIEGENSDARLSITNWNASSPGQSANIVLNTYNLTAGQKSSTLTMNNFSGDAGTPGSVTTGNWLGAVEMSGYGGGLQSIAGRLYSVAEGTFSASSAPSAIRFQTTALNSTSAVDRVTINNQGHVGIGTTSPAALLDIATNGTVGSAIIVPRDSSANRPMTAVDGMIRYNTSDSKFEFYQNGGWINYGTGSGAGVSFPLLASPGTTPPSTPSYSFDSDANTGLYSPAADTLALSTAGTAALTVNSAGMVGVGTMSPIARFTVRDVGTDTSLIDIANAADGSAYESNATVSVVKEYSPASSGATTQMTGSASRVSLTNAEGAYDLSGTVSIARNDSSGAATTLNGLRAFAVNTSTGSAAISNGIYAASYNTSSGSINTAYGANIDVQAKSGSISIAYGVDAHIQTSGGGVIGNNANGVRGRFTGTAPTARGGDFSVAGGTTNVTNAYGVSVTSVTGSNVYGLYINTLTGATSSWAIYSNNTARSYLGGNLTIGTTTPGSAALDITGTTNLNSAVIVPRASTANRPGTATNGMIRYNTTDSKFEFYQNNAWVNYGTGSGGGGVTWPLAANPAVTSAGAPSYSFTSDTNTGMYTSAADTLGLSTAGTARLTILPDGKVGIGTTSPSDLLDIYGSTATDMGIKIRNKTSVSGASAGIYYQGENQDYTMGWMGYNSALTAAPYGGRMMLEATANNGGGLTMMASAASADMRFIVGGNTAGAEKMRILANGRVGIGTTSPTNELDVNGTIRATDIILTSDERAKKFIRTISGAAALEKLMQVRAVNFVWRHNDHDDQGVIAQELRKIYPELVIENSDGTLSVKYPSLIAPVIASVQQLKNENDELKARMETLEKQNAQMREDMQKILREISSSKNK